MKKLLVICSIILLTVMACKKEKTVLWEGKITGSDFRKCICCGGWWIEINTSTYRFYHLPENSNIDLLHDTLPIYVKVRWQKDKNACIGDEIIIDYITKK
jgi:hypothetical protein